MLGSVRSGLCGDLLLASAGFQAIAVAVHLQNVDVVGEPVEQRPGEPLGTEDPGPLVKWQIARHDNGAAFVTPARSSFILGRLLAVTSNV